jgi:serine/threonine-protein kinase
MAYPLSVTAVELGAGSRLLDYRLEALLGRGGMSVVYLAEELGLGRKVAIKLLAPELAEDDGFRERFVRESELAASIDHPHVIPIYGAGESDGRLYIAMRYVAGTDLTALLRSEGALKPVRAVEIVAQLAEALDVAHGRGLVHRDVKPANVLLSTEGGREHVYLSDFGVAKSTSVATGLTAVGQRIGTIDYVAPEQIRGEPVDGRADQYSLGCLLFECLTGEVPFRRETDVAVIYGHLSDRPPALGDRVTGLPASLDAVVARALAKRPGDRYETCGEMAAAAEAALASSRMPDSAGPVTGTPRTMRVRASLPRFAIAIGLAIAMVIVLAGGASSTSTAMGSGAQLTGTYETQISGTMAANAGLTGTWRLGLLPGGRVRTMRDGVTVVRGAASVAGERVTFSDWEGSMACFGPESSGLYRWVARGGTVSFTALDDRCTGRRIVLLANPWIKVG